MSVGKLVLAGLIVVGISGLWCYWTKWCWWCPRCPDVEVDCSTCEPEAMLVVEEIRAASWVATDNRPFEFDSDDSSSTATGPAGSSSSGTSPLKPAAVCADASKLAFGPCGGNYEVDHSYRHGVLFQTGHSVTFSGGTMTTHTFYEGVFIRHSGGEVWLLPGEDDDFDWLDINPTDARCVLDPLHAYGMFNATDDAGDPIVETECDDLTASSEPAFSCARNRSIHYSVIATRILTYWADEKYGMYSGPSEWASAATAEDPGKAGSMYTFEFPDTVTVDRWNDGCWEERYEGVTEIRILFDESAATHYGFEHPPVDGGSFTYPPSP